MNSNTNDWKEIAIQLYYGEKKSIPDIVNILEKSISTISRVIRDHDYKAYCEEKEKRKQQKREKTKKQLNGEIPIQQLLKQRHDRDVNFLSKYG